MVRVAQDDAAPATGATIGTAVGTAVGTDNVVTVGTTGFTATAVGSGAGVVVAASAKGAGVGVVTLGDFRRSHLKKRYAS